MLDFYGSCHRPSHPFNLHRYYHPRLLCVPMKTLWPLLAIVSVVVAQNFLGNTLGLVAPRITELRSRVFRYEEPSSITPPPQDSVSKPSYLDFVSSSTGYPEPESSSLQGYSKPSSTRRYPEPTLNYPEPSGTCSAQTVVLTSTSTEHDLIWKTRTQANTQWATTTYYNTATETSARRPSYIFNSAT